MPPKRMKRTRIDPRTQRVHKPFYVLAFDPGGTTGWASAEWKGDGDQRLTHIDQITFKEGHLGPDTHHLRLYKLLLDAFSNDIELVCESFEFRQHAEGSDFETKKKVELISREYIGIIRLFAEMYGISLTMNTASSGKVFISDEKLKLMDLYTPGMRHANDAKRHLARYLSVNKRMDFMFDAWLDPNDTPKPTNNTET